MRRLVVLSLLTALASAHAQTGVVRANGVPVPGAIVKATKTDVTLSTVTGDQGQYKLDGMTAGHWVIEVQMFRFQTARKEVEVNGPSNLDWELTLQPLGAPVAAQARGPRPGGGGWPGGNRPGGAPGSGSGPPGWARRGMPGGGPPNAQAGPNASAGPNNPAGQARGARAQQQGNTVPELTNQLETQDGLPTTASSAEMPAGVQADSANEAFLLNGTLSRNMQQMPGDFPEGGPGFGPGGPGGQGGPFGQGENANPNGGPGAGPGFGGPGGGGGPGFGGGGPGGGFGGGGFGGRGGGGFGGRGGRLDGRGDPANRQFGRNRTDNGLMGNRRNRGQQGIHGMVNVVLHNSLLDARPFAINGQEVPKPSYSKERFSVQIGGPLMIPKLFRLQNTTFNFNYTNNRSDNLSSLVGTVPTGLERAGNFSESGNIIYDPMTNAPFPGNVLPANRISSIAIGLLQYFPSPNQTGSCSAGARNCIAQNFRFTDVVPNNNQSVGLRIGQSLGRKDRLALNFQFQDRSSVIPQIFGFLDNSEGRGISTSLNWMHTFAPRVFNNATISFNRNRTNALPFFANSANVAAALGILGTGANPLDYGPPNLGFTNFAGLTDGSAALTRVQSFTMNDGFNMLRGKHNLGFGTQIRRAQNNVQTDSNGRGTLGFTGLGTSGLDANGQPLQNTGYDLADFLLGLPNSSSIRYGDSSNYFRSTDYHFFGQDDWRMLPNLTLNFGLRYEYYGVPHELYGHEVNLDVAPGFIAVAPVVAGGTGPYSGSFSNSLVNPDRNNFAPRFGVAWKPWKDGKTVIRSGYGVYYNGAVYNSFARNLSAQPPFAQTNSVITSNAAPLTLANGFIIVPPGKSITNTWAIDRFYRVPYAQTWNFMIQQDLPARLVLQVSYLGTKGTRLDTNRLPNRALPGSQLTAEERLKISNAISFTYEASDANSIYNSARVNLMRRFSRGTSFNLGYIFSKAIDDASTFGGGVAQNDLDIRAERSLSNFDHRHVVNATYLVTSPVGHNSRLLAHHGFASKILEDWTLSGSLQAQTGAPLNPRVAGNLSDSAGTGATGTTRPNATGLPVDSGSGYFNTAAFALPVAGFFGNAGRNTITGPGSVILNGSFGRSFGLGERRNFEFRFDATNVLNQVNITSIGTVINANTFGLPLAASAMRSMSVTLRFRF